MDNEYIIESSEHYYTNIVGQAVKLELRKRYAGRGRHYHTWEHIREMFRGLELVDEVLDCLPGVALAVMFHDVVYEPRRGGCEARSVGVMRRLCKGLTPFWLERADTLIMATANGHRLPPGFAPNSDAGYFLDLDLAILGAGPQRYGQYVAGIRKEYGHLTDLEWRRGRSGFVKMMLARAKRNQLFHTDWGKENFNAQSARNLRAELAAYAAPAED